MNVLFILTLVAVMARAVLILFALIYLTGLVWFAGSFGWLSAISGVLVVVGSLIIALVPRRLLLKRSNVVAYFSLLFLTAAAIMFFVYKDLFGSVASAQRAGERMFHILLLVLVGGSVLWHTRRTTR